MAGGRGPNSPGSGDGEHAVFGPFSPSVPSIAPVARRAVRLLAWRICARYLPWCSGSPDHAQTPFPSRTVGWKNRYQSLPRPSLANRNLVGLY
ncbi:unnamed protein product [Miscanthus lutarioriparius]|uniref:Uncharacterized protein n=1 Tax=Miscanthus lutarioriparius TaxID=422564 RepID=A0A811MMK6_9POAL|nr:unnamed protein product [Miscanthus lutarioriparius]